MKSFTVRITSTLSDGLCVYELRDGLRRGRVALVSARRQAGLYLQKRALIGRFKVFVAVVVIPKQKGRK